MGLAVGGEQVIVEAALMQPRLEIAPPNVGIEMRRPGHGERVHAVGFLEHQRGEHRIFAARARHQTIVRAVARAVLVAHRDELTFAFLPIELMVFSLGIAARVAKAVLVEVDGDFLRVARMLEFDRRRRPLVGDHAAFAECHFGGEAIFYFRQAVVRHRILSPDSVAERRGRRDRFSRDETARRPTHLVRSRRAP